MTKNVTFNVQLKLSVLVNDAENVEDAIRLATYNFDFDYLISNQFYEIDDYQVEFIDRDSIVVSELED